MKYWLALVVTAGCGCGGHPARTDGGSAAALEEKAAEADRTAASMQKKTGTLSMGDAASKYTALFANGALRRIDEKVSLGDYGSSSSRYYYDGVPHFPFEEKERTEGAGRVRISLRLYFGADGRLVDGRKSVDGVAVPVEDVDIRGAYRHALALGEAAGKAI